MHYKMCIFATVVLLHAPAWAINKCTAPGGKISFQDAPCTGAGAEIIVKPAAGFVAPTAATTQTRTQANLDVLQGERIRREKWLVMNNVRNALSSQRNLCAGIQRQLAMSKGASNNNLAGAVRDMSISQEMTAAAIACDSDTRAKEREVAEAEKLCQEIKCIPAF